jgi:hypothetical protein
VLKNQKIKVLHFGLGKTVRSGVFNQLLAEEKTAKKTDDFQWDIRFSSHDDPRERFMIKLVESQNFITENKFIKYIRLRYYSYKWLLKESVKYDAILLRYPLGDPILPFFVFRLKRFYTVHHTRELAEIKRNNFWSLFQLIIENMMGNHVLQHASGIIGVTQEIADYEKKRLRADKPAFVYPNGIVVDELPPIRDFRLGVVKLIFVCSKVYSWHGLDLICEQLQRRPDINVELHLVGVDRNIADDPRIICHDPLPVNELAKLFRRMDIGLSSFGLHRNGMLEACPLKTRDYFVNGLPVYAGHIDSAIPNDFQFLYRGEFDIAKAVELANEFRKFDKLEIQRKALPYIDKRKSMRELVDWLKSQA